MIIYQTTNLITGIKYIGKDKNNNPNYIGSGADLKIAIKEYGKHNFKKEIIEYCNSIDHLVERETYWLNYYDVENNPNFYNKTNKPFGNSGLSEETKQKIANSRKGIKLSEDVKLKMSTNRKGHEMYNKEWKNKISNSLKGRNLPEITKQKISEAMKNTVRNDKWKKAIKDNRYKCVEVKSRPIQQLDKNNNLINEYKSITEAKNTTNIKGIPNALTGLAKTAGGFIWKYKIN